MFDPLPDELAHALAAGAPRLGPYADVRYCAEVDSTNDVALALASAGASEGVSVIADLQRRGRGRRGHDWFSPPEAGLYLSVIIRPDAVHGPVPMLTIGAGVAMAEAVADVCSLPVELKWPNDLVIGRPWRKLGGVLAEAASAGGRIDAVVVGVGINIRRAAYPRELADRVTSVETELGRGIDRGVLAVELLARLREVMAAVHAGDRAGVAARWRRFAAPGLDAPVRWSGPRGLCRGVARGIADDGALLVEADGHIQRVVAGAVTWEGLSIG
jgi:BirA family biotin operon repressor/biotin-[acetyl-CoA-carboxylase] ligase